MRVLTVNAGTSSLKLSVVAGEHETLAERELGPPDSSGVAAAEELAQAHAPIDAVAHRLVHGGTRYRAAALVDDPARQALERLVELAPLHMPPALRLLDALRERLRCPQVACFDTAFHASLPPAASTFALPSRWRELGVRRYGFHGLSCAWSLRRAAAMLGAAPRDLQLVVAHLGSGASVTAVRGGASADTSMGMTPLDGLVMSTRSGSVDPGALLWLQRARGVGAGELDSALEHESGLLALAGSADMREVVRQAGEHDDRALLALDVYVHRACAHIAAVAAALDRLDALVFTGGVGEHAGVVRGRICGGLRLLQLPAELKAAGAGDAIVSGAGAAPAVLVVHAREDLEMAIEAQRLLAG